MAADNSLDRIAEVFHGRTIFISGATGFVGKALVEKLLRSANVKKIYVLIRKRKGKTGTERFEELFNNVLFKTLLSLKPDAPKKCVPINGDVTEVDLGISPTDRQTLINEVNFIFHSAATTKFDDTISYAVKMNTRGTKYMLELAEQCKQLELFIHVSTAYAFPSESRTLEKEYKLVANPHEVLNGLSWIQEDAIKDITKKLLGKIPNSYTFSKSLAEALVYEKVGKIPLIICRLAVVIPSFSDPFPGWFNNLQGPMGLFVAAGKGVIRSMYMDSNSYANMVPIDATVSGLMVFSWYYLKTKNPPYIFNACVPQKDISMTWEEIMNLGREIIETKAPFNGILWYPGGTMTKSRLYNQINFVLFQLIPAIFIDALLFIFGYKPILYNIQMRIRKGAEMFEFYTTKPWDFETTNVELIRDKLTEAERKTYVLKPDKINVKEYLFDCMMACRRNYLKETDDMLPAARRNMKIMFCLDRFIKIAFFVLLAYYIYKLKDYVFS